MSKIYLEVKEHGASTYEGHIAHDGDKYHKWAKEHGFLDPEQSMPDDETLAAALGDAPRPPQVASSVEPYQGIVEELLDQGVEMTAIWQRLKEDHKYTGSYSSVRRFVHRLRPQEPEVVVRVHTAPGEEAQVDFGSVGQLYDPSWGRDRRATPPRGRRAVRCRRPSS